MENFNETGGDVASGGCKQDGVDDAAGEHNSRPLFLFLFLYNQLDVCVCEMSR